MVEGINDKDDKENDMYATAPEDVGPDLMERPKRAREQIRIGPRAEPPSVPHYKQCERCGELYFVAYEDNGRRVNLSAAPDPEGHWKITGSQVRHEVNAGTVKTLHEWFVSPASSDEDGPLYRLHKHHGRRK